MATNDEKKRTRAAEGNRRHSTRRASGGMSRLRRRERKAGASQDIVPLTSEPSGGRIVGRPERLKNGGLKIVSEMGPPPSQGGKSRQGFERQFFPGVEIGLEGWQRAHSQGSGTGAESKDGIRYAPAEVNQELQNRGIEKYMRLLYQDANSAGIKLYLTLRNTHASRHPATGVD